MESDPAMSFANLNCFHYYESKQLKKIKKTNYFKFIDDLTVLTDGGEFESKNFREIYSPELELKKENIQKDLTNYTGYKNVKTSTQKVLFQIRVLKLQMVGFR